MQSKVIKIILAILFFVCLANMPYGYYQLVRFVALVGFAILAYYANDNGNKIEVIIFIALAILFQPLVKIALGRNLFFHSPFFELVKQEIVIMPHQQLHQ